MYGTEDLTEYYPKIYKRVYRRVLLQDAQDVTQEVFLNACRNIDTFNGGSALETWLFSIADHKIATYYREQYRYERRLDRDCMSRHKYNHAVANNDYWPETDIEMDDILSQIDEKYQTVIRMVFCDGMLQGEAAEALEISYDSMRRKYRSGMKQAEKITRKERDSK